MTDQGTNKTGFVRDNELKREIQGQLKANRAVRAEEAYEPEPSGEDQPVAEPALAVPPVGTPPGMTQQDVSFRSELARHLDPSVYPARRSELLASLHRHQAPDPLVERVAALPPDRRFPNLQAVMKELGYGVEARRV